jgi:protein-S-isoprenylcysteine O-methyltransferase Ste14
LNWDKICKVENTAQRVCQFDTERQMSFFQPQVSNANEASVLPDPILTLKGQWATVNFMPVITVVTLALGISRIGSDGIVQDLHAGASGVLLFIASLIVYFVLNNVLARKDDKPFATTGIFAFSRNPAYLAFFLPLAALFYFDPMTSASCIVAYVVATNLLVIQQHESELQATYGADFTAYRNAVPRWFA